MDKVKSKLIPLPENPPATEQPVEPSIKPPCCSLCSKPFICLLIAIFAVVVLAAGGYYLLAARGSTPVVNQPPSVTPMPTPTPDLYTESSRSATAGWKTYTSDKYGFSIKYPSDWSVRNPTDTDPSIYFDSQEGPSGKAGEVEVIYYVFTNELYNPDKLPFEDLVTRGLDDKLKVEFKFTKEKIGRYTVYKTESLPSRSGALNVYFTTDEYRYILLALTPYSSKNPFKKQVKYEKIFDQILSTFKFTD